jgi:hypothetical protein
VIVQAGNHIAMAPASMMMIHEPAVALDAMVRGNSDDMRALADEAVKTADVLDKFGGNIAGIYAARAGGTEEEWLERMKAETWYRPQEAVDAGLADEVANDARNSLGARAFNLSRFKNVPEWAKSADPVPDPVPFVWTPVSAWDVAPYLAHHTDTGAIDHERIARALERARNPIIPVADREGAIRHLESHLSVAKAA